MTHLFQPSFALALENLLQVASALRALLVRKIWAQIPLKIFVVRYYSNNVYFVELSQRSAKIKAVGLEGEELDSLE